MDRKPGIIGNDRLVFWQPLPATDGEMCQWVPASAAKPLAASLQQVPGASSATAAEEPRLREAARAEVRRRRPLRVIKDAHPGYAGVAVDPVRDEVVLTDENHFRLLVYDRMENTSV